MLWKGLTGNLTSAPSADRLLTPCHLLAHLNCGCNDRGAHCFLGSQDNPSCRNKPEIWKDRKTEGVSIPLGWGDTKTFLDIWSLNFCHESKASKHHHSKSRVVRDDGGVQLCQVQTCALSLCLSFEFPLL